VHLEAHPLCERKKKHPSVPPPVHPRTRQTLQTTNTNNKTIMDPERIHAYLQAACAGLGFDIGEVWFSSNETGTSTVAKIGELV